MIGRLPSAREHLAVASSGGRLYVVGGADQAGTYLDDVLELSPEDGRVLRRARLPTPLTRAAAVPSPAGVLVLGGWTGVQLDRAVLVDTRGPQIVVEELPRLPRGVSDVAAVEIDGQIVIAGGTNERFARQIGLWSWDPQTGESRSIKLRSFLAW